MLPQPEPRAVRQILIMPPIRSREVARAQRSGVGHGEDALQPLDLGNGLFSVHPSQYLTERRGGQFGGDSELRQAPQVESIRYSMSLFWESACTASNASTFSGNFTPEAGWLKHKGVCAEPDQPAFHLAEIGNLQAQNQTPIPFSSNALARMPHPFSDVRRLMLREPDFHLLRLAPNHAERRLGEFVEVETGRNLKSAIRYGDGSDPLYCKYAQIPASVVASHQIQTIVHIPELVRIDIS
jgi:hypothetical protein